MKRTLFALLLASCATSLFAEPAPRSDQPLNFYWRGGLYRKGWQGKGLPLSPQEGTDFLKLLGAGTNPTSRIQMETEAIADPQCPLSAYDFNDADWDIEHGVGVGSKALIQIFLDQPPKWWAKQHPDQLSAVHPAYAPSRFSDALINPDSQPMLSLLHRFMKVNIDHYQSNPGVKGFLLGCGVGQIEMALGSNNGLLYGYGPTEQEGFRKWLRDGQGYSLAALGTRWYGDANHFASWSDVTVPPAYEFFGWEGAVRIPLTRNLVPGEKGEFWVRTGSNSAMDPAWSGSTAGVATLSLPANLDAKAYPPNQTVMRRCFDVSANQLATLQKDGGWLYLQATCHIILNGKDLGTLEVHTAELAGAKGLAQRPFPGCPFALRIDKHLIAGSNTITLLPTGPICSPIFLSSEPPRTYPYLGTQRNARYVDWIGWEFDRDARMHRDFFSEARQLAPNTQLEVFSPHGGMLDYAGEIARDYKVAVRFTGGEAYYFPWYSGAGRIAGYEGTIEPSANITTPDTLRKMIGWSFFNNDQTVTLFWDMAVYASAKSPVRDEMLRLRNLFGLFGKYRPDAPALAFLYPSRSFQLQELCESPLPYQWDPGRGEIQPTGIEFGYATETPVVRGLPENVRVLMDTGAAFMEPKLLKALTAWVEKGGTFIALQFTGRNELINADTWPIAPLTGFQVEGYVEKPEMIRFEKGQKLWPSISGGISGTGTVIDYLGQDMAGGGIRLKPMAEGCETIARWADGTVAIGQRKVGKGRVIVLGSTFWRNGRDYRGVYSGMDQQEEPWLAEMLQGLGVRVPFPTHNAGKPVWLREVSSKVGDKRWLIAFNPNSEPVRQFKLNWKPAAKAAVIDLAADPNAPVPKGSAVTKPYAVPAPRTVVSFSTEKPPTGTRAAVVVRKSERRGDPGTYLEATDWGKGMVLSGSFDLSPNQAGQQLFLSFPLRGNGAPVTFALGMHDANGVYRYYPRAVGHKLSINGTNWVKCRVSLNTDGPDFGSDMNAKQPFDPSRIVRIQLVPSAGWENFASDPHAWTPKPVGVGAMTLERENPPAAITSKITRGARGTLQFDLMPFQTRVLVPVQ